MDAEHEVGPAADLPPGTVTGAGSYAVGNVDGTYSPCPGAAATCAPTSRAGPSTRTAAWCARHQSAYDVRTGRMVRGPRGRSRRCSGWARRTRS